MKLTTCAVITVLTAVLHGCCASNFTPILSVSVYDEATGARLCGFKVNAADDMQTFKGENIQALECDSQDTRINLWYPGTFKLTVEKPGYKIWQEDALVVRSPDSCQFSYEHIKVYLKKE